jgi:hypothetical protein
MYNVTVSKDDNATLQHHKTENSLPTVSLFWGWGGNLGGLKKTMNGKRLLSLMMVLGLLVSLSLLVPTTAVWADKSTDKNAKEGGDNKIVVTGLQPGESVFTYVGLLPTLNPVANSAPPGNFNARVDSPGGGQIEIFAPVGKITAVYVFNPGNNSYRLIGIASPSSSWPDTILNAGQSLQMAQQVPGSNKGLASPAGQ